MLDKYMDIQSGFYNFINLSFANNKISHAYLIEKNGVCYADDLALDLAKFFLCDGVYDEKICSLVDSGSYSNFFVIDSLKEIKKEEILDLKKNFSFKANDDKKMVYLIKDASLLNNSSANSLLKFLEEPEDGIIAILVADNVSKIIDTISSRCQIISLVNSENFDYKSIFSYYNCEENECSFDDFVEEQFNLFLSFYESFEKNKLSTLVKFDVYSLNDRMKFLLKFGLYFYFDILNIKLGRAVSLFLPKISFMSEVVDNNEIDDIIYKIDVINKFIRDSYYNVNMNLFMDNFIISMGGK